MKKFFMALLCCLFIPMLAFADKTYDTDVVVVGAGASGVTAALQAAELGAKVVIIEKLPSLGGGTICSGLTVVGSDQQNKYGFHQFTDKSYVFKKIMDYNHYAGVAPIVSKFINESNNSYEWLKKHNVKFDPIFLYTYLEDPAWHPLTGHCAGMLKSLIEEFKKYNITALTETPGKSLIIKNGKVAGVIAESEEDGKVTINAKSVIIATGGYGGNPDMVKKYAPFKGFSVNKGSKFRVGDGINMALSAGADTHNIGLMQWHDPMPKTDIGRATRSGFNEPFFWVNKEGKRFMDETYRMLWAYSGNASLNQPDGVVIKLLDAATVKHITDKGGALYGVHDLKPNNDFNKSVEMDVQGNKVVKANSIKELVQKLNKNYGFNMDEATLQATIKQINDSYANHEDSQFFKNRQYLREFKTAPYYALVTYPAFLGSVGGIKVDENAAALDADNKPVPGLFVVGLDSGGMLYGDTYNIVSAGQTLGWAVNSGRFAAIKAVDEMKK